MHVIAVGEEKAALVERHNLIEINQVAVIGTGGVGQTGLHNRSCKRRVVAQVRSQAERRHHRTPAFSYRASERRGNGRVRPSAEQGVHRPRGLAHIPRQWRIKILVSLGPVSRQR